MAITGTIWHGTGTEWRELAEAASRNCMCAWMGSGRVLHECSAHQMLGDQRTLDRFLFARSLRKRFLREEFIVPGNTAPVSEAAQRVS
jgi:hypothetical protein